MIHSHILPLLDDEKDVPAGTVSLFIFWKGVASGNDFFTYHARTGLPFGKFTQT